MKIDKVKNSLFSMKSHQFQENSEIIPQLSIAIWHKPVENIDDINLYIPNNFVDNLFNLFKFHEILKKIWLVFLLIP